LVAHPLHLAQAKAVAEPFAYEEYRKEKIREALAEESVSRVKLAAARRKLPQINKRLAKKLLAEKGEGADAEAAGAAEEDGKKKKEGSFSNPLGDERFKDLFLKSDFEVGERIGGCSTELCTRTHSLLTLSICLSLSVMLSFSLSLYHSLFLFLSFSLTHTHTLSLSPSLSTRSTRRARSTSCCTRTRLTRTHQTCWPTSALPSTRTASLRARLADVFFLLLLLLLLAHLLLFLLPHP
jgi:hypothetical protein